MFRMIFYVWVKLHCIMVCRTSATLVLGGQHISHTISQNQLRFDIYFVCLWVGVSCASLTYFGDLLRRTAPKFGTHVRIDILTLTKIDSPPRRFRGLSIVKNLSRRTAPKFGTHVRIYTLTLNCVLTHSTPGGLGGYILLKIFRDEPRPNLARMCG